MSLGAGAPAFAGDATRAKAAGRRQRIPCTMSLVMEAAA